MPLTARIVRTPQNIAVPTEAPVLASKAGLRLLNGGGTPAIPVAVLSVPGRSVLYMWESVPAADDDGRRLNAGGFGASTAGWRSLEVGPIDIREYGADTASSNNATAINRALAAAAAGVSREVVIPNGTFETTAQITVASTATNPVTLRGEGHDSHIHAVLAGTNTNAIASSGTDFSNFTLRDMRLTGTFSRGLNLSPSTSGSNVRIERCTLSGATAFSSGVTIAAILCGYRLSDVWIEDNVISGGGFDNGDGTGQGYDIVSDAGGMKTGVHINRNDISGSKTVLSIACFDCADSEIADNTIDQNNTSFLTAGIYNFGYGIAMYDAIHLQECKRNHVRGNTVTNAAGLGIYFQTQYDSSMDGNKCFDVCKQITEPSLPLGALVANTGNVLFANNTIRTTNKTNGTNGIAVAGPDTHVITGNYIEDTASAVRLQGDVHKTVISGNTFRDCTSGVRIENLLDPREITIVGNSMAVESAGIGVATGATLSGSVISGNTIDTESFGIYIDGGADNRITGNTVRGVNGDYAIRLNAGADNALVSGNTVIGRDFGIYIAANNCAIVDNDLTGAGTTKLTLSGTGHTVRDNRGSGPGGGVFMAINAFTGGTSATVGAYTNRLRIRMVGGGGGGGAATTAAASGAAGGGGGAGAFAEWHVVATPGASYTYAIGAAGAGGVAGGAAATAGGNTTFQVGATTITAPGGGAGTGMAAGVAPLFAAPGNFSNQATNATINGAGAPGSPGIRLDGVNVMSGNGGSGPFGAGGVGLDLGAAGAAGVAGLGYGSGGGGGMVTNGSAASNGGAGKVGIIILEEYT